MGTLSKDKRDIYYRKAKEEGWRARLAFKLLQLNEEFDLFSGVTRAVDLCAAPGLWLQVLLRELSKESRIVAVDIQKMAPIEGVKIIQADITHPRTLETIYREFDGSQADMVICDGAPDITGMHDLDEYIQSQLVLAALQLATCVLKPGGSFVSKIFRGRDVDLLYSQMGYLFERVVCAKPRASRGTSIEAFIVCLGYMPRPGWVPSLSQNKLTEEFFEGLAIGKAVTTTHMELPSEERIVAPFIACGDLLSFDSDATYRLDPAMENRVLSPVQMPINPPYNTALTLKYVDELWERVFVMGTTDERDIDMIFRLRRQGFS